MSQRDAERSARLAGGMALMVPAALLTVQGGVPTLLGGAFALVVAVGLALNNKRRLGTLAQLATHVIALAASLGALLGLSADRPRFGLGVAVVFLGIAIPRLWWRDTRRGMTVMLGLGLIALMGFARAVSRGVFGASVGIYVALALVALMLADPTWRGLGRKRGLALPLSGGLALAAGWAIGLAWLLPAAEPAVAEALRPYIFQQGEFSESGFGDGGSMQLGSISRIVTSDEVVMRVHGETDYLRGQVYVDYHRWGEWKPHKILNEPDAVAPDGEAVLASGADSGRAVRIEASAGSGNALFAPLDAVRISDGPPGFELDQFGLARPPLEVIDDPREWTIHLGAPGPDRSIAPDLGHAGRGSLDLAVLHPEAFGQLARAWTRGAETDAERLDALVRHFHQHFEYSLEPEKTPPGSDPTLHFLTGSRAGHCELFASGMVLLARSLGIPARVAAGYRVFEYNSAGEYFVVRKRDAHAWVEAWTDGRWRRYEPTPPGVLRGSQETEPSWFGARWDVFKRAFGRVFERLADLSAFELLGALSVVGGLLTLVLFLRTRRKRREAQVFDATVFEPLAALEAHLARAHGAARPRHMTLEDYAVSLRAHDQAEAAELVEACAALRYGRKGDAEGVSARIRRFVG